MKILLLLLFALSINTPAFANAKTQLEKVNQMSEASPQKNVFMQEKEKIIKKENINQPLTNYQYDEKNYHYNKYKNFIEDNIKYSQSGKMKY